MKYFHLKPAVAAIIVAGSLCAASVRAGDVDASSTLGAQIPSHPSGNTENSMRLSGELIGSDQPTDREYTLLAPFVLAHVNLDMSGPESSEAVPDMALGPQYRLDSTVTLGGTREGHDNIAFGAHSEIEPYTFGLRITF